MGRLSRRQLLVAAGTSALGVSLGGVRPVRSWATPTSTRLDPVWTLLLRGIDEVDGVLVTADLSNGTMRQSPDWARTWSAPKGLPPGTVPQLATKLVRFGDRLYCAVRDIGSASLRVYASPPAPGDAPYQWSDTGLVAQPLTSAKSGTQLACDGRYLYAGEYGDPPDGPRVYRSSDGASWETVFSSQDQMSLIGRTARHVHAVAPDPINPGDVYLTTGDFGLATGAALWRSRSFADPGSWEVVLPSGTWQSSQISFGPNAVWLAADNPRETAVVVDRASLTPASASPNLHSDIPVPGGAPGDAYLEIASHGRLDPATGVYYCVATTGLTGNTDGMFAIPSAGSPVELIDPGGIDIRMRGEVFIAAGQVWSGQWFRPLLSP